MNTERLSEAAYFGACPRCRRPARVEHYFKQVFAACPDCRLYLGHLGFGIVSAPHEVWESPATMHAELGCTGPLEPDWQSYYDGVAEGLRSYESAEPIYDIGPPYIKRA